MSLSNTVMVQRRKSLGVGISPVPAYDVWTLSDPCAGVYACYVAIMVTGLERLQGIGMQPFFYAMGHGKNV